MAPPIHSKTAREFRSRVQALSKAGYRHGHKVAILVEFDCGCTQEELFPLDLIYAHETVSPPPDYDLGVEARKRLGHSSGGTGTPY